MTLHRQLPPQSPLRTQGSHAHDIAHFAIHAEDCQRAKSFYEQAFGWTFEAWGPPNFWRIHTSPEAPVHGALQERRAPVEGEGMTGYECTLAVLDIAEAVRAIRAHGGKVTTEPFYIEDDGTLAMFEDTEGNVAGAMQYDEGAQ